MSSGIPTDDSETLKKHKDFVQFVQSQQNVRSKADNLSNFVMFSSEVAAATMFIALEKPLKDKPLLKWASVISVGLCGIFAAGRVKEHYLHSNTEELKNNSRGR